jgi:epsilon-lactone hydrolase
MASARRARHVPRVYEIRVRGALGPMLLAAFPDMTARRVGPDTVLGGVLADPAAVYGVIHRLEAFALELVEVRSSSDPRQARIGEAAH